MVLNIPNTLINTQNNPKNRASPLRGEELETYDTGILFYKDIHSSMICIQVYISYMQLFMPDMQSKRFVSYSIVNKYEIFK